LLLPKRVLQICNNVHPWGGHGNIISFLLADLTFLTCEQAIVWTLWSLAFSTTIARVVLRWRIQGTFYGEDYLAFLSFLFFTGLTGVVVAVTPMFDMSRNYLIAASNDPLTPTPLPLEDFTAQTITALKLMFA
jgi:hypothetical protein